MLRFKDCEELDPVAEAAQSMQLSCKQTHWKPWDTLAADQSLVHPNNVWVSL